MAEQCGCLSSENLSQYVITNNIHHLIQPSRVGKHSNPTQTLHPHPPTHTHTSAIYTSLRHMSHSGDHRAQHFPPVEPFRVSAIHFKPVLVFINSGDFYYHQAKNDHYDIQMFSAVRLIVLCPIYNVLVLFIRYGRECMLN